MMNPAVRRIACTNYNQPRSVRRRAAAEPTIQRVDLLHPGPEFYPRRHARRVHDAFETDERLLRLDADEISATSPAGGLAPTLDFEDEVRPLVYLALVDCAQAFPGSVTDEELRAARELAASAIERLKARGAPDWI